jgi:hypothetical protein
LKRDITKEEMGKKTIESKKTNKSALGENQLGDISNSKYEFLQKLNGIHLFTICPFLSKQNFRLSILQKEITKSFTFSFGDNLFKEKGENFCCTNVEKLWTNESRLVFF